MEDATHLNAFLHLIDTASSIMQTFKLLAIVIHGLQGGNLVDNMPDPGTLNFLILSATCVEHDGPAAPQN